MQRRYEAVRITYNHTGALVALRKRLVQVLLMCREEVIADTESRMLTPEGRADVKADKTREEVAGIISTYIILGPWAVMDEYGKGSLMDQNNPFLQEYKGGELWNPARKDSVIRGRPAGSYTNIFGEKVSSQGKAEGRNLERIADATGNVDFMPHPPSHAMETAMRWMANGRFQEQLTIALNTFPWGSFLIVG